MSSESTAGSGPASPPPKAPAEPQSCLRLVGLGLAVAGVLLLGAYLLVRALIPGTTVTVINVGNRSVKGIVLLAVSEGSADVRGEWPVGTLRPGETREIDVGFSSDTHLATRIQAAHGAVVEDRVRIYLGSSSAQSVSVELNETGVVRAHAWRRDEEGSNRLVVQKGLEPVMQASPLPK